MDLALALHRPLVEVMQLPSWEITAWQAFNRVEPFGERRADYRAAQVEAAMIAIYHAWVEAEGEPPTVEDLLLKWKRPRDDTKPQALGAQIDALKAAEAMRKAAQG